MMALTMQAGAKRARRARRRQPLQPRQAALKKARSRVNHRIAFFGHATVYTAVCVLLLVVAGPLVMFIVALSWGIGLAAHGFFGVAAPLLRDQWIASEVGRQVGSSVTQQRRHMGSEHARRMHQLSASVAHEIRNPITAAKSLVQQMGEDPNCAENAEYAKVAVAELDRVERSIAHLLRYAREEPLKIVHANLQPIVASAMDTLRDRLGQVEVTQDLSADDSLFADPDALRRVLINLLGNALDALAGQHTPAPNIIVTSGRDLSGQMMWLRVRDNGPGLLAEDASEIFNPFHTSKDDGTGLGLAISKKLVEAHGGTIELNSQVTTGCELLVTLPVMPPIDVRAAGDAAEEPVQDVSTS